MLKLMHPDLVLKDWYSIRDYDDFQRNQYVMGWTYDPMPKFVQNEMISKAPEVPLPYEISVMWTMQRLNYKFFRVGKQFECLF